MIMQGSDDGVSPAAKRRSNIKMVGSGLLLFVRCVLHMHAFIILDVPGACRNRGDRCRACQAER